MNWYSTSLHIISRSFRGCGYNSAAWNDGGMSLRSEFTSDPEHYDSIHARGSYDGIMLPKYPALQTT